MFYFQLNRSASCHGGAMGCNPTKELHEDIKPALHSAAFVAHSPASSRVTTQDAVIRVRDLVNEL